MGIHSSRMFGHCLFLVALVANGASAQVALGGVCWSSTGGVVVNGCASGTQCGPWLPNGGTWDGNSPWYCLALPKLTVGASCDYNNFRGLCATGLSCCSGVCTVGTTCTTTAPTVASTTVASTTAASTTAASTTAASTTAASTTAACDLEGKVICGDTSYPALYTGKCCASPYTCTLITGSTRTSVCQGSDLPSGSTCWTDSVSSGSCASGTICTKANAADATGTCQASTCSGPTTGVSGQNICYNGEAGVSTGTCCPNPSTGSTSVGCYPDISGGSRDSFCMAYNIPEGSPCGTTAAENYAGICGTGLTCASGVCSSTATTAAPATCGYSGQKCWDGATMAPPSTAPTCCNGAPCAITSFTADANCPTSAGTKPCSPDATPCTGPGGINDKTGFEDIVCCTGLACNPPTGQPPNYVGTFTCHA